MKDQLILHLFNLFNKWWLCQFCKWGDFRISSLRSNT